MIRTATASDTPRAVELLRDSHASAGFDRSGGFHVPFSAVHAARLFTSHLHQDSTCAFVLDVGGVAQGLLLAIAYEHPFGPVRLARETVWWIDPAHRGRSAIAMLDTYEAWARSKRCAYVGMAGIGQFPAAGKLYLRRGYEVAETHYLKAL